MSRAVVSRDTRTQPWSGTPQTPGRSRARTEFVPQAKSEQCQGLPHLPVQVGTPPIRTGFVAPLRRSLVDRCPAARRAAATATPARGRSRRGRRPPLGRKFARTPCPPARPRGRPTPRPCFFAAPPP